MYRQSLKAMGILWVIGILLCSPLFAQGPDTLWTKTYGGTSTDRGNSVQQTIDNGYIIVGNTLSFGAGSHDVYLIKTNENGNTLWTKTYGGAGADRGYSVQQTTDTGYIITGHKTSAGESQVYLIKTNENGDTLWTKTYGGDSVDWGNAVQQTTDNGYIIAGHTRSFGAGSYDVYFIKTDENGNTLWTKTYGGPDEDRGYSVQQTTDTGYIIAGYTNSFGAGDYDVYLIKTNENGDTLWTKTYGGPGEDQGYSVQQTTDTGYIIAGYTNSFGAGDYDVYLIKTNENGDTLWTKTYGGPGEDQGNAVQQTTDNGYIIAGHTLSFGAGAQVYLIKTNEDGDTSWAKTYGGTGVDWGNSVRQTTDTGYIIAGYTNSFGAGAQVYLIKIANENEVSEGESDIPLFSLGLKSNPVKGKVLFELSLPQDTEITLKIYDSSGRLVDNLSGCKSAGYCQIPWSAKVNGVYFYTFESSGHKETGKLVIVH
jgi:hypothetical protein